MEGGEGGSVNMLREELGCTLARNSILDSITLTCTKKGVYFMTGKSPSWRRARRNVSSICLLFSSSQFPGLGGRRAAPFPLLGLEVVTDSNPSTISCLP